MEKATYYASPDGKTVRMEQHLHPIRVKNAKGDGFTPIDTTLAEIDGVIKPKAVKGELTLSAGDDAFVLKSKGSKGSATIGSPGELPKPTLKGSTATYPSLYGKGIDLVVTATATGFKQEIVLRERVTGPVSFRIPTTVPKNLALEEDSAGKPALLSQGKKIADLPAALLLDAVATDLNSDADAGKVGKVAVTLDQSASALVYTPDPAYLADPAVAYPVTLAAFDDDWWEPELGNDTFVNNADYPNGYANSGLDRILVGKSNDGAVRWRSYIRFDEFPADHPIRGATVQNADLVLWNHLSSDCGEFVGSGITAYQVTERWDVSTLTWSSQPRITTTGADTEYAGYAGESCTGAMNYPWDLIHSVDDIVQAWADGEPNYGLAVLDSPRFADKSPAQVWAILLDEGVYLCSQATMYRLLRERGQSGERRAQAVRPPTSKPELEADRPNLVWSWDITKLKGPVRGVYYLLYVIIDIFSRKVIHWDPGST